MSYAELERLSNAFGAALVAQGVKKGERVTLLLPNSPQAVIAQLGAWKAGAIVSSMNSLYTERELENTPAALKETSPRYPEHTAIIFKGTRLTYRTFDELVDRFAAALQGLGIKKGDRVAIHLPNCPQFPIAYYAILRAGGIMVLCNPLYQTQEMTHQLTDSGAQVLVTLSAFYPLIKRIRADTQLRHVIVAQVKTYLPPLLKLLFTLLMEKKKGDQVSIAGDANTYWFTDLLAQGPAKPQPVEVKQDDTAVLMYTGGTTGVSKGAQLTHKNILVNACQSKVWVNAAEGKEITLTQLPLFHAYGMTTCLNLSVLIAAAMILVPDPRDIDDVLKTIDKFRPTLYPGVPAMYIAINNHPHLEKYHKSIRACFSGAAGPPMEVQQRFQQLTGARLVEGYAQRGFAHRHRQPGLCEPHWRHRGALARRRGQDCGRRYRRKGIRRRRGGRTLCSRPASHEGLLEPALRDGQQSAARPGRGRPRGSIPAI